MGKASEVNSEEKTGVEPLRQPDVDIDFLLAAPAANRVPDVLLCVPLDRRGEAERGVLESGQP